MLRKLTTICQLNQITSFFTEFVFFIDSGPPDLLVVKKNHWHVDRFYGLNERRKESVLQNIDLREYFSLYSLIYIMETYAE